MSPAEISSLLVAALPQLRAFARSIARDADRADDLVQDTAVQALAHADRFMPGTNFRAWAFTILRHLHLNARRRARCPAAPVTCAPEVLAVIGPAAPASQESRIELRQILAAVAGLPPAQREAVGLAAGGASYDRIAALCGCPIGTAKSRLHRGRAVLARARAP